MKESGVSGPIFIPYSNREVGQISFRGLALITIQASCWGKFPIDREKPIDNGPDDPQRRGVAQSGQRLKQNFPEVIVKLSCPELKRLIVYGCWPADHHRV